MKSVYCLLFGLFFIASTQAQSLWEAGYFIDNSGKKTQALIKKRLWRDNPTEFEWKKTISSTSRTAKIEDIKEFAVGEDYLYKRYILKFDLNGDTVGKSTRSEDPNLKIRKVFLRLIVRSETSLYQYSQNDIHRFFYTNYDTVYPELLIYKIYYTDDERKELGEKVIPKVNNTYQEQLKQIASCGKLDPTKLEYNQTDLKRYFVEYNKCKGNEIEYIIRKKINQTRVGIIAAVDLTGFSHPIPAQGIPFILYDDQYVPRYGLFIESFIPFSKVDLSFFLEGTYKSYTATGLNPDSNDTTQFQLDYKNLHLALAPRIHIYLSPKFEFFLEGGLSIDFDMGTEGDAFTDFKNVTTNFFYGGGFGSGRFKVGYRMYTDKNISESNTVPETTMDVSSLFLTINLFGHKKRG